MGPYPLVAFAVYWLVLFVACFAVCSQGQDALYDEPTPGLGLKVTIGSLILALLLTYTRTSFATMFTDRIGATAIQGIAWFAVFTLIFRFQPWHALAVGLGTMLIITGLATLGVDSLTAPRSTQRYEATKLNQPVRRPSFGTAPAAPAKDAAAAPAPASK